MANPFDNTIAATVRDRAKAVGENWYTDETYYKDAENWTHLFWDEDKPFFPLFKKMDASNIVDLACGRGRNSYQMRDWTNRKTLVDIVPGNIEICKERFAGVPNVHFLVTGGSDLDGLSSSEYTALFCYDAMVHFDHIVVYAYLVETFRILTAGGMALFHHSNFGAKPGGVYTTNPHWRNFMPSGLFLDYATKAGFSIVDQKLISLGDCIGLDALTLVRKP